jgi:hypothetical protein
MARNAALMSAKAEIRRTHRPAGEDVERDSEKM